MLDLHKLYTALFEKQRWLMYIKGFALTLEITVAACAIGIVLGVLVAGVKVYAKGSRNPLLKIANIICTAYTTIIRGTPMMLQLLLIFGAMQFLPINAVAIFGFGINSGAYVSEIFRGGINSVDIGQMEAGRSLGLSQNSAMWYIVLPQAVKNTLPALFNELISLLKETSIAGAVAVNELTKVSNGVRSTNLSLWPLIIAGVFYLATTWLLTVLQGALERRLARSDRG